MSGKSTTFIDEDVLYELCGFVDFIQQHNTSASVQDIKLTDMYRILKNPYSNLKQVHRISRYLTNKHGVIKDTLRMMKSLPTLNYHLAWSSLDDVSKIKKYENKVHDMLSDLKIKKFTRDSLYELAELGTVSFTNRNFKYLQFLELDEIKIDKQRNGKWVVEYDLLQLKSRFHSNTFASTTHAIQSLPDEISVEAYNRYLKKGEDYRYVELKDSSVIGLDAHRNFPWGLPFSFGAWIPLMQKEIINRVERSVSDRLIKQVLILTAGNVGGKDGKPAPKQLIEHYFQQVSQLMKKKENGDTNLNSDSNGTGVISLPDFFDLKALDVDTKMFNKDVYNKIDADIFSNLGVSSALIYGGGSDTNYSVAQMNSEKLFRYIFTILEEIEYIINDYIKELLPKNLRCKFYFDRTTMLDRDKQIANAKEFYMQTGVIAPWAESLLGVPINYTYSMASYEKEVLETQNVFFPPQNAYTSSGNENQVGRPSTSTPSESTSNSQSSGGNNSPSPSD